MTTPEEFFDDIEPIFTPSEEIGGMIFHAKAVATAIECIARQGENPDPAELWHLVMSVAHRAARVRYAIANREEEVKDGLLETARRVTALREAIYENRPVPEDDAGFNAWWKKLTGTMPARKAA